MMNDKCKEVMDFMDKNPEFKGLFYGFKKSRGGLGISRIDNDWWGCEDYYISYSDLKKLNTCKQSKQN